MRRWSATTALALFGVFLPARAYAAVTTITNTANLNYVDPDSHVQSLQSNTVSATVLPNPTPAQVTFYHFTSGAFLAPASNPSVQADGSQCMMGSSYQPVPAPRTLSGQTIDLTQPITLTPAQSYHIGEPVFIGVKDLNRNVDPQTREFVVVEVITSNGDHELVRLHETTVNSGEFIGVLQSVATAGASHDCQLSLSIDSQISVHYVDTDFPSDIATVDLKVDPYGRVFDSSTGKTVDNVSVHLVDANTNQDAQVFADDGVTPFPATVVTGSLVHAGNQTYQMPAGEFRFPLVPQGNYKLKIESIPASYTWPTVVPPSTLQNVHDSNGNPYNLNDGYQGGIFTVTSGPSINIDVPVDPLVTDLILTKTASQTTASIGDFVRYELNLTNAGSGNADGVIIDDVLPRGFRYRHDSLIVDGNKVADPSVGNEGLRLSIPVGSLASTKSIIVSYVLEITAGTGVGRATNSARARRANGTPSNTAQVAVDVQNAFFDSHAILFGRLIEGECGAPTSEQKGVPKVRVLMDDGTYVTTDDEGRFHFEKVKPGTHVVRVDENSAPANLELIACDKNTRFAGRANSQFVDVQGGALWRTDFYFRHREIPKDNFEIKFTGKVVHTEGTELSDGVYTLDVTAKRTTKNIEILVNPPEGFSYLPDSGKWKGPTEIDGIVLGTRPVFRIPALAAGEKGEITFHAIPQPGTALPADECLADAFAAQIRVTYGVPGYGGQAVLKSATPTCGAPEAKLVEEKIAEAAVVTAPEVLAEGDKDASGGNLDWTATQAPGVDFLFPAATYNPRSPSTRIVVKHGPLDTVELRVNGEVVSRFNLERVHLNVQKTVAATEWKGVPIKEGDNLLEAAVRSPDGSLVQLLKRTIHYATTPEKFVYVPERSKLMANGIDKPRIAIRVLDKFDKPVRKGVKGTYKLNAPYVAAQFEELSQTHQLSALENFQPEYTIATDDGIAFIELTPTNDAGEVQLHLILPEDNEQQLKVWLEPEAKDWVVVGFAEGTAGFKTLKGNMQNLPDGEKDKALETDGQTKLYAKGKIPGNWIVTLAYDSQKDKPAAKDQNFKGIINPTEFYTLYGDQSVQRSDAASSEKIYFKIERSKFYALFGDYDTGMTDSDLGRYNRSLTGVKSEYSSKFVGFKVFGSQQDSLYYKEEIQGQGTSFLYRLARGPILINSEKVKIQIRDRFRSEKIISEQTLSRDIDYRFDYLAATITFKTPVAATDSNFNPQFIVIEYETTGAATKAITYGGRVEGRLLNDKLKAGVTDIHEDDGQKVSNLEAVDVKVQLAEQSDLKLEGARSDSRPDGPTITGAAYQAEVNHRNKAVDLNAYVRKAEANFGIGQEALSEKGSFKTGGKGSYHLTNKWDLNGQVDHLAELSTNQSRDVASTGMKYHSESGSVGFGYQHIDEQRAGVMTNADEATGSFSKRFFKNKFELVGLAEHNLGPKAGESIDYPDRYSLKGSYQITEATKVFVEQEMTQGQVLDTSTTRAGFETLPWKGGKLNQTINQEMSEAGPRTYSTMGLGQSLVLNKQWTMDAGLDASRTLRESGAAAVPINPAQPIASGGFVGTAGTFTENYVALSTGATYRAEPWTANFRIEDRMGSVEDKYGFMTNVIRELAKGTVLSSTVEFYASRYSSGAKGNLVQGDVSLASRPIGGRWTILDKLKARYETVDNAASLPIFGQTALKGVQDAVSSALVNNFNLNRLSTSHKNQFSVFYGAKETWDRFDGKLFEGFTDLWGLEVRQDISEKWDLGFQGSVLHSWNAANFQYSFGPSVGWSPATNGWVSLGYNFRGFYDRDFEASRYTQQGVYLKMRLKFDEKSLGLSKSNAGGDTK